MIERSDIEDMHAQLLLFMDQYDIALPALPDFDFSRVEQEFTRLRSNIPELWKFNRDGREFLVGDQIAARGLTAQHPVVLIPGVISTVRAVQRASLFLHLTSGLGLRIMVNESRLSTLLSGETMGWLQYVVPSHFQQREMDFCHDVGSSHWFGPAGWEG